MVAPLDTITTPNTEIMRGVANYFFAAASTHAENTQALDTNQSFVSKSWQGQGETSYGLANQKLLLDSGMHQSQMWGAGNLLTSTAAQFDWGNTLQTVACGQWETANTLAATGQVEAAALWEASAQSTQQSALTVINQARVS